MKWEVLIGLDEDCPQTMALINQFRRMHDQRVVCFTNDSDSPLGAPAMRNLLTNKANGEFLCFLDQDDMLFPTALIIRLRYIERNGWGSLGTLAYCSSIEPPMKDHLLSHDIARELYKKEVILNPPFKLASFIVCRKLHLQVRGFPNGGGGEEWLYFQRLRMISQIGMLVCPTVFYRQHGKNESTIKRAERNFNFLIKSVVYLIYEAPLSDRILVFRKSIYLLFHVIQLYLLRKY